MKIKNICLYYKRNFPTSYKYLSLRLKRTKDPEEKACIYIGICTLFFFFIGLSYDAVSYVCSGDYSLFKINVASLGIYVVSAFLFEWKKLGIRTTLIVLLFTIQINVSFTILYNSIIVTENDGFTIYHDLFISFLACILAALTLRKKQVYILCTLPLTALAVPLLIHSPILLIKSFPSLCLAYASPPIFLAHICIFLWNTLKEKERFLQEKHSLCRLLGMSGQQWELLIDVIQEPHAQREKTEELFKTMQKALSDQLVIRAKRLLFSEELMVQINKKRNLLLTPKEIQLCCLILEDKPITEISKLLYTNKSTVRTNRSRIRKKLGLQHNINLKAYLQELMREEDKQKCTKLSRAKYN